MRKIVGITGGIACGKSSVSKILSDEGYMVIDCDKINRTLLTTDKDTINTIAKTFGDELLENGIINRKQLAKIIFSDEAKRKELNAILHPRIKEKLITLINELPGKIIFIEVPLLFESDFYKLCDYTVVVYLDLNTQLARLRKRDNLSFIDALARIRALEPMEEKIKKASFVIDNRHRLEDLNWQVSQLLAKILE